MCRPRRKQLTWMSRSKPPRSSTGSTLRGCQRLRFLCSRITASEPLHGSLGCVYSLGPWQVYKPLALSVSMCPACGFCFAPISLGRQRKSADLLRVHLGMWRWLGGPGPTLGGAGPPQQQPEENPLNPGLQPLDPILQVTGTQPVS